MKGINFGKKDGKIYYSLGDALEKELEVGQVLQLKDNLSYMYKIYEIDVKNGIIKTNKILKNDSYSKLNERNIIENYYNGYVVTKYTHDINVEYNKGSCYKYLLRSV